MSPSSFPSHLGRLTTSKSLHALLLKTGLLLLLPSSATRGDLFDNLVRALFTSSAVTTADPSHLNLVLSSLSHKGLTFLASKTFSTAHRLALAVDSYSLCSALSASAQGNDLGFLGQLHGHAWTSGWLASVFVGGALIGAYVNLGVLRDARKLFDEMSVRNTVCANALLGGYCRKKQCVEGLELVRRMEAMCLEPDGFTFSILLTMCAELPAARLGVEAHAYLLRRTFLLEEDVFVLSSLVEMYGKCGFVDKARAVFDIAKKDMGGGRRRRGRDVVLWTSMLNAYSRNGWFEDVIAAFEDMLADSIKADGVAFVALLSACSRVGRVAEGLEYFESMRRDHRIVPWPEHYGCVVDLLSRAGELEKALQFANEMMLHDGGEMHAEMGVGVWGALLSACRDRGDVEVGEFAARRALELDPGNGGVYVELSNLYAKVGRWHEIEKLRGEMKEKGSRKDSGSSRLEPIATS